MNSSAYILCVCVIGKSWPNLMHLICVCESMKTTTNENMMRVKANENENSRYAEKILNLLIRDQSLRHVTHN